MPSDGGSDGGVELDRRRLLAAVGATAMTASAGCTLRYGDWIHVEFGNDERETPTDYGYGGTPTETDEGPTRSAEASSERPTADTDTPTPTATATPTPADDYGEMGYGQYGYGG